MNKPSILKNIGIGLGAIALMIVGASLALNAKSLVAPTAQAQPSVPNPGHNWDAVGLPEGTWPNLDADKLDGYDSSAFGGSSCYTNWNDITCASGWTAVSTGVWTVVWIENTPISGGLICAADRAHDGNFNVPVAATRPSAPTGYWVDSEPCAVCCK